MAPSVIGCNGIGKGGGTHAEGRRADGSEHAAHDRTGGKTAGAGA